MKNKRAINTSYVIYGFMCERLGLGGSELLVYALIYSFTRCDAEVYFGSQDFLARATGLSLSTVKRALSSLIESGLVERCTEESAGGTREGYRTVMKHTPRAKEESEYPSNDAARSMPSPQVLEKIKRHPAELIESASVRPKYELYRLTHKGIVEMTAEQYKRLLELVSSEVLHSYILRLELLIERTGYKTFNPYKTIRKWILEDCSV
ncbi:MAG: helix-turn-helix domain-containing protein [Clostridia bacterium]|nr:helix-turn-helix domain-containing protein [Clostridia bacterium]